MTGFMVVRVAFAHGGGSMGTPAHITESEKQRAQSRSKASLYCSKPTLTVTLFTHLRPPTLTHFTHLGPAPPVTHFTHLGPAPTLTHFTHLGPTPPRNSLHPSEPHPLKIPLAPVKCVTNWGSGFKHSESVEEHLTFKP